MTQNPPDSQAALPPAYTPPPRRPPVPTQNHESETLADPPAPPADKPPVDEPPAEVQAPGTAVPVQVDHATFLAARLRETLAELANLRDQNADLLSEVGALRKENAKYKANLAQAEIDRLDEEFDVGQGTILQKRKDGTYWRLPREALQQAIQQQG